MKVNGVVPLSKSPVGAVYKLAVVAILKKLSNGVFVLSNNSNAPS
jgi:hypothetical protein